MLATNRPTYTAAVTQITAPIALSQRPRRPGPDRNTCLATTDRYLRHIAPQQLLDAMRGRAWEL